MNDPTLYVTDTHSLLWYLYDIPRLGVNAKAAFDMIGEEGAILLIPAIVLAEIVYIVEHRRHDIDVDEVLDQIAEADNFQIIPFDLEGARALISLVDIPEMHDRMIVAVAQAYGVPLITRDELIHQTSVVECIW